MPNIFGSSKKFGHPIPVRSWSGAQFLEALTVYKSFIRPHLDYGDIIHDQVSNASFHKKLESIQHNATTAITGAIWGNSKEKPYQELDF